MFLIPADEILNVPVGNAVLLRFIFPFANIIENSHCSFEYQIESKLIGKTTPMKQNKRFSKGCSSFTNLALWTIDINQLEFETTDYQTHMHFNVCICTPSISFGMHSSLVEDGAKENNKILLIKRDHCNISDNLEKKFECIDANEEITTDSDTLDKICE
ncbi:unnamed protein product [Mytilus coruscus]|uniref:Uncharacterized protein n=1 Tax=Mytilus coruscus TaxID=42192 RepID=A0A6J8BT82_MYTCO|nr:unnamed protein product [Mytilus coruscus]